MQIKGIVWTDNVVSKIQAKQGVAPREVEEVLLNDPECRRVPKGRRKGQTLYYATGCTDAGRHLFVVFIFDPHGKALILSGREMTPREKRGYRERRTYG